MLSVQTKTMGAATLVAATVSGSSGAYGGRSRVPVWSRWASWPSWPSCNAYLLPLPILSDPSTQTLPLGVARFSSWHAQDTAGVLAFTSIAMIPALVFFLAVQNRIVDGLQGAVKG